MNLEDQVVSLNLAKKLKELRATQDSIWKWYSTKDGTETILSNGSNLLAEHIYDFEEVADAFTVAELGSRLPCMVSLGFKVYEVQYTHPTQRQWGVTYKSANGDWLHTTSWHTEADARAKMLIWLIEEGYIITRA